MLISDAEKPKLLKFLWCLYEQMQKKPYTIEVCLMLISSDPEKQELLNYVWC